MFQPLSWLQMLSRQPNSAELRPYLGIRARASSLGSADLTRSTFVWAVPRESASADTLSWSAVVRRSPAERDTACSRSSRSSRVSLSAGAGAVWLPAAAALVVRPPSLSSTPVEMEMPTAAAATPVATRVLRRPVRRAERSATSRCFGTYFSRVGTGELTDLVDVGGRHDAACPGTRRRPYPDRDHRSLQLERPKCPV